jgi:endogenous inhibitor of DNA gyrase (YacG/DUF329 family)
VVVRECPTCGGVFEVDPGRRGRPQVHCSQRCAKRAYELRVQAERQERRRAAGGACKSCGMLVSVTEHGPVPRFCSRLCWEVSAGKRAAERPPERVCALAECEVWFVPRRSSQRCCSERHGKILWHRRARRTAT